MTRATPSRGRTPRGSFGELERAVLDVLWSSADPWVTVRVVHERLSQVRDLAYTTVLTVLDRLVHKGYVQRDRKRGERAHLYRASGTRGELTATLMFDALGEFGPQERSAALMAFVDDASAADVAALRLALARTDSGAGERCAAEVD